MEGGLTPEGKRELEYAVLTSTHGSGASNFDPKYAEYKRSGDDKDNKKPRVNWNGNSDNPYGRETKYDVKGSAATSVNTNDDVDNEW